MQEYAGAPSTSFSCHQSSCPRRIHRYLLVIHFPVINRLLARPSALRVVREHLLQRRHRLVQALGFYFFRNDRVADDVGQAVEGFLHFHKFGERFGFGASSFAAVDLEQKIVEGGGFLLASRAAAGASFPRAGLRVAQGTRRVVGLGIPDVIQEREHARFAHARGHAVEVDARSGQ